jgi:hypothetical protein
MLKCLMIAALIGTASPAWADTIVRLQGDPHAMELQLSRIDTAYRKGCIDRRDRDEVWRAAESAASMTGMDWERIRRNAKSFQSSRDNCEAARNIVDHARAFNTAE